MIRHLPIIELVEGSITEAWQVDLLIIPVSIALTPCKALISKANPYISWEIRETADRRVVRYDLVPGDPSPSLLLLLQKPKPSSLANRQN